MAESKENGIRNNRRNDAILKEISSELYGYGIGGTIAQTIYTHCVHHFADL